MFLVFSSVSIMVSVVLSIMVSFVSVWRLLLHCDVLRLHHGPSFFIIVIISWWRDLVECCVYRYWHCCICCPHSIAGLEREWIRSLYPALGYMSMLVLFLKRSMRGRFYCNVNEFPSTITALRVIATGVPSGVVTDWSLATCIIDWLDVAGVTLLHCCSIAVRFHRWPWTWMNPFVVPVRVYVNAGAVLKASHVWIVTCIF